MSKYQDRKQLDEILENKWVTPYFQPIYDLSTGQLHGHEALTRGPQGSSLFTPDALFSLALEEDKLHPLEILCREQALLRFSQLQLPGKLYLNVSASLLCSPDHQKGMTLSLLQELGLSQKDIVIELSEQHPYEDHGLPNNSVEHYRNMGFQVAIDDLGAGYSGLQRWSTLRPDIVKIDMHFVKGIDKDDIKREFVRSILAIAKKLKCLVIAEGIETQSELDQLIDIGIDYGQGYFLGRPTDTPNFTHNHYLAAQSKRRSYLQSDQAESVQSLCRKTPHLELDSELIEAAKHFKKSPKLFAIPVLKEGKPLGVIRRHQLHELFSTPYGRSLYENKPVTNLLSEDILVVEASTSLSNVSTLVTNQEADSLNHEFIVVSQGRYIGTGHLRDLLKRITELKIQNATYSNPLTLLPGNVPIHRNVNQRLAAQQVFHVAYFDLNDFKPFNDFFGYSKGDLVIQLLGNLIKRFITLENNFIGHIGGDDFVVIFESQDWRQQCQNILDAFANEIRAFYPQKDLEQGGVWSKNRAGELVFHPILSLAIGVVCPDPTTCKSHHEVAEMAALAKKAAKHEGGNHISLI